MLFLEPTALVVFVQIGLVVSVFALSNFLTTRHEIIGLEARIIARSLHLSPGEIVLLQQRRQFLRFLNVVTACGVGYFGAAPILLLLMTCRPIPGSNLPPLFIVCSNFAFLVVVGVTCVIALFYLHYRLFRFRSH